jgi:hypothetical protein
MGLVPSRASLHEAATSPDKPLPYISRPVESYVYKTNRTERTFGSGVPGVVTGITPLPAALPNTTMAVLHGGPSLELSLKIVNEVPDAVFIDDPAEASAAVAAAVAASRPARRGSCNGSSNNSNAAAGQRSRGQSDAATEESAATQALRSGKALFVYYYEHRVLPLTKEFFPSPDCILFQQLWHARQQQNPRYHFQLDQTWSPGALMDPTAHYESFLQLANSSLTDIEAACLTAGGAVPTRGSVLQAQSELGAVEAELRVAEGTANERGRRSGKGVAASPVPFATREEFYNLVVRTTEESMLFDSDDALRSAILSSGDNGDEVGDAARPERIRPVPCAIVLVRRCMTAQEYRYTYYLASHERHHRTTDNSSNSGGSNADAAYGGGQKGNAARRRGSEAQRRDVQTIAVTGNAVRAAVTEAQAALRSHSGGSAAGADSGEESLVVPWLQVSVPQAPLDLAELRVVGMYGCWTVEEVLRHTLFLPATPDSTTGTTAVAAAITRNRLGPSAALHDSPDSVAAAEVQARMDAVLRRACPHGVPSSTLLNVGFFEKQVGDKEQCHTYFSLCRLFAHGMRECILRDAIRAASASALETMLGGDDTGDGPIDAEIERERMEAELRELKRQQQHPTWQKFLRVLAADSGTSSSSCHPPSVFADLSNCFLIRFSYVPQLQLCRQLRLLLNGMAGMYPEPISLEAFQAAQRQRNMAAMAKKQPNPPPTAAAAAVALAEAGGAAEAGSRRPAKDVGTVPPAPHPASGTDATLGDAACRPPLSSPITNTSTGEAASTTGAKPHSAGLSLDPDAISECREEHPGELQRLKEEGFCCYASDGLVVFRISRACVARALNQLGFASMKDSIEALCVTLTAAAPPPLTYRGELRPPSVMCSPITGALSWTRPGPTSTRAAARDDGDTVNCDDDDNDDVREVVPNTTTTTTVSATDASAAVAGEDGSPGSVDLTIAAVRDLYCNAIRYSGDVATGFAAQRLFHSTGTGTGQVQEIPTLRKAAPLEQTPDVLIGVLPRNPIEQRRGRLLPLRGLLLQEARVNGLHASLEAANGGEVAATASGSAPLPQAKASLLSSQQQLLMKVSEQHQFDVYTVSEALDGVPFRRLMELTHQVEQQRHSSSGSVSEEWPDVLIEAVDAQGNAEPDSVLNWSPMAALGGRARNQEQRADAAVAVPGMSADTAVVNDEATDRGESTTPVYLSQTLHSAASTQPSLGGKAASIRVSIRVHDPDRILHTGDRIRFAPCPVTTVAASPLSGDATSPSPPSAEFLSLHSTPASTPSLRSRKTSGVAATTAAGAVRCGYWYVDDVLTTEDMVLSWMRRVSGRARETRGDDTKWVRYPSAMLSVILQFVRVCRQKPYGSWLSTGHPLRLLHPMDDELVESDMLQNFPDIVRTRRFRQWRFSHDGYVYFHGVTVRMPGSAPPLQAAGPPASASKPGIPAAGVAAANAAAVTATAAVDISSSKGVSYEDPSRLRYANATMNGKTVATTTTKSTPPAVQQLSTTQIHQQQHQQQQQSLFASVPRPPPVIQRGLYGDTPPQTEEVYGSAGGSCNPYPSTYTNMVGVVPAQQVVYQSSPFNPAIPQGPPSQASYQQMPPQQAYYYAAPADMNGNGMPMQPQQPPPPPSQQPSSVTMYVPVAYTVEPYYVQQGPNVMNVPQPPASVPAVPPSPNSYNNNSTNGNGNALYFKEMDVANVNVRNANASVEGGNSIRSPGGGSQQMHFSLHHMDSANSLRSYDRTASNAVLGPTHVTGSFYGEFYGQSPQQPPPTQLPPQLTSPSNASVQSTPEYHGEGWLMNGSHPLQGTKMPNHSAATAVSQCQDTHATPQQNASHVGRRNSTDSPQSSMQPSSHDSQLLTSPHPQQSQQRYETAGGRASGVPINTASRRSTADYPPRRTNTSFLAGRGTSPATVMLPTVQRAVSRPIQTVHADPTKREVATIAGESGAPLRLPLPKSCMPYGTIAPTAQTPLTPIQQQQQLQQQQHVSVLTSPHLSSTGGSFREGAATTADVIESDGITVHVMQRKPSMPVRRAVASVSVVSPPPLAPLQRDPSCSGAGGAGGVPTTVQTPSSMNNGASSSTADASAAYYGAMGVSPTGGVDAAAVEGLLTSPDDDARSALAQLPYEMPAVMTPTNNSQANSFAAGGGGGLASGSTSRIGGGHNAVTATAAASAVAAAMSGVTTPPQRHRSLRVSHNPYATRDVGVVNGGTATPSTTSIAGAHPSVHSHAGTVDAAHAQSGHDSFQAALDAQYGGSNDFSSAVPTTAATGVVSPAHLARGTSSAMAHGVLYGRSGASLTADAHEKHNSFYVAAPDGDDGEPQLSYSSHEMYRNKIADGTTQGFYYSMDGPDDGEDNAAQQLYGRDVNQNGTGAYAGGQRQESSFIRSGSTPYGNIPAPPALHRSQRGSY